MAVGAVPLLAAGPDGDTKVRDVVDYSQTLQELAALADLNRRLRIAGQSAHIVEL